MNSLANLFAMFLLGACAQTTTYDGSLTATTASSSTQWHSEQPEIWGTVNYVIYGESDTCDDNVVVADVYIDVGAGCTLAHTLATDIIWVVSITANEDALRFCGYRAFSDCGMSAGGNCYDVVKDACHVSSIRSTRHSEVITWDIGNIISDDTDSSAASRLGTLALSVFVSIVVGVVVF